MQKDIIESATLNEEGELEIIRCYPSGHVYMTDPPRRGPDKVVKEIYRAVDGRIVLVETIQGRHTPAHMVDEQITF